MDGESAGERSKTPTNWNELAAMFIGVYGGIPVLLVVCNALGVTALPVTWQTVPFILLGSSAFYLPMALSYRYFTDKTL